MTAAVIVAALFLLCLWAILTAQAGRKPTYNRHNCPWGWGDSCHGPCTTNGTPPACLRRTR